VRYERCSNRIILLLRRKRGNKLRHHNNLQRNHKMKFTCLFINKRTNAKISKEFTVAQIDKYLGEYIKDRAIKRGHTTTTVVKRGDNWKVTITYSK